MQTLFNLKAVTQNNNKHYQTQLHVPVVHFYGTKNA